MRRLITVVVAAVAGGALAACSSPPETPQAGTASVKINGDETKFNVVHCSQSQWFRTIRVGSDRAGATIVVDEHGEHALAESVSIENVGGFTGKYSLGAGDAANIRFDGHNYLVSGVAAGAPTATPNEPTTAEFKISAKC